MSDGPPPPLTVPRSIKPRKPKDQYLPILSVGQDIIYAERTGVVWGREQLPEVIEAEPSSLIVCIGAVELLAELHEHFKDNPRWQFRVTPVERTLWNPAKQDQRVVAETLVHFLGFSTPRNRANHYHRVIDPVRFTRGSLPPSADGLPLWEELLRWGREIRSFLSEQRLNASPTAGGVGAQFLRDRRFYPDDRRRVPTATNERARPHLPGNHYEVWGSGLQRDPAFYFDQHHAHHAAVLGIDLPHADGLYSRGRFSDIHATKPIITGDRAAAFLAEQIGLVRVRLTIDTRAHARLSHPVCRTQGEAIATVYTNELADLAECGATVLGIIAAWTSPKRDEGLPRYAAWATEYLDEHPELHRWLKPTLLTPYGLLAAKPKRMHSLYARAKNGEETPIMAGRAIITAYGKATKRAHQTPIANVIQRGMIEAEVRRRSLSLARDLAAADRDVLAVYSDALFVADTGSPVPMLPPPWRVKGIRTNLRFLSAHAYVSSEESRLPGIPQSERVRYLQRRAETG